MLTRIFACSFFLIAGVLQCSAQNLEFVENKGQWNSEVLYMSDLGGSSFFLQKDGYKVLLNNHKDLEAIAALYSGHFHDSTGKMVAATARSLPGDGSKTVTLHSFAYEVKFEGAAKASQVLPDKPLNTFNNYFIGSDSTKWKGNCRVFQGVTYSEMYPGVDVRYYTDDGNLKYDLIVHPNADISKIALRFKGVNGLSVKNGNLIVKTSLGEVNELKPYSYQQDETGRKEVVAKYVIDGDLVRFKIPTYNRKSTLVIDPTLIFASFTGSASDNWGYTATYDGSGNFYAGGIAFGNGYPVSTGAFQTIFGGGLNQGGLPGYDVAIIKLSPNGSSRIYATYLGGGGNEQPHSLIVDKQGDLVIAGRTNSSNFPTTTAGYGPGGGYDIFISVLDPSGSRLVGSRQFGGTGDDGVNIQDKESVSGAVSISRNYGDDARSEVIVDNNNNIYLASCTKSSDFPTTANAFQKKNAGMQDAVVIKASTDLSNILFSTYLGGKGDDATFVLAINPSNNDIYVGGATTSNNLQATGTNNGPVLFNSFRGGICDGFVSIISNNGNSLIKTCYVGSPGDDLVYGVQFDRSGFPYIMGTTTGTFPVINANFSQASGKQFISKLQPGLTGVVYSTIFGKGQSTPDISPTAFLVDRCENVYVAGWGGGLDLAFKNAGTIGLTTTSNAIRRTSDGSDFYFFILEKNALSQLYGTFYGNLDTQPDVGDHVDGGTSRFDSEGIIYEALCANCQKVGVFPTTPGVWAPRNVSNTGAQCNEALLKIAFEFAGVGSGLRSSISGVPRDTSGCVPLTVDFTDTIGNGKKFIWRFGDGSNDTTTLTPSLSHTYTSLGTFTVRLISIDSTTCNIADTSYLHIRVRDDKSDVSFTSLKLQPCDALLFQFDNTSVAPPGKPFSPTTFEWVFGDGATLVSNAATVTHGYPAAGTYNVVLRMNDTSYCNYPDSAVKQLRIAANVVAQFETPPSGCAPYDAIITNTSLAGTDFQWDFGDGTTSTEENPVHLYNTPGTYTIRLVATDTSTCNKIDSTSQTIVVSAAPTAAFTYGPQVPKENTPITFNNGSSGATSYIWTFGDGDSLVTTNRDTPVEHIYNASGTYTACLVAINQYGCTDTTCQDVQALISPLVDVASAFTPNGDGVNDLVFVRGYGITKMDWRIFNRWGTMVFQSSTKSTGWDGTYKGTLQPMEVYVYILDVTFSDGTHTRKKGDITLLR